MSLTILLPTLDNHMKNLYTSSSGRIVYSGIGFMTALLLSSCATLSRQECLTADWQSIGYTDGVAGYSGHRLQNHSKACAKVGVSPNLTQWEAGRQQGLKQYCTLTNAYKLGLQGYSLNSVCPTNDAAPLENTNYDGRRIYRHRIQINEETEQLKKLLSDYEALKAGSNLDFQSEKEARAYLLKLPTQISNKRNKISELKQAIADIQNKYGY